MLHWFYGQLPDFARPEHPVMKYMLLREGRRGSRFQRIATVVASIALLAFLFALGYIIANPSNPQPGSPAGLDDPNLLNRIFQIIYWPLVIIQVPLRLVALGSTVGVVSSEIERGTWDTLKITTDGAKLTIKTRWAAVFYRLRWALLLIVVSRLYLVVALLINLAQFQGRYIDLLLSGTTPFGPPNISQDASVWVGVLVMALELTAVLIIPFTALALDASLGMFIGTLSRGRFIGVLFRVVLLLTRVAMVAIALWFGAGALSLTQINLSFLPPPSSANPSLVAPMWQLWAGAFLGVSEGDLGLTLLHVPYVGRIWADIDYGVWVGPALLAYALLQAQIADLLLRWTAHRVTKADRI